MSTVETNICGGSAPRRHNTFNGVHINHVQDLGLINGITHYDKQTHAYGPRTTEHKHTSTQNGIKPNGYVNHGFWSKRTKKPCAFKKESEESNTPDNTTAKQFGCNGSVLVNEARNPERGSLPASVCDKLAPDDEKNKSRRKKKKPRHKQRHNQVSSGESNAPQAQEDWESEIQEVTLNNWEKMSFGRQPYGPEDVVNFTLRDMTMEQKTTPLWQVTANYYIPATHHQQPVEWYRYKPPTLPGQFSDVDE